MQQTLQAQKKMKQQGKTSAHNIFPTHNGALSHIGAFLATLGLVVYSSTNNKGSENKESLIRKHLDSAISFIHLLTFATWLGIQVWVHVSGKRVFFNFFSLQTRTAPSY
jgi:hypothetical protein